jgi:4-hydroxybenzoate polyprenyltransferase
MLAYCLRLKDLAIVDALVLAGGYALRVLAGGVATGITAPLWLLGCCVLLFFSLALLKRYAELVTMRSLEGAQARTRGYRVGDSSLVAALGGSSGCLAVIVLALYAGVEQRLHPRHELLWLTCILLSFWIGYMWLMAHRGRIRDDPVAFAVNDRVSQVLAALIATTLLIVA